MYMIEILALENGAHRNQTYHGVIPPDWGETAFIREDISTFENFPFGSFEVEYIEGVAYMIAESWTPGEMPEPEPTPEPENEDDVWEQLDAAYQEGVNSVE